MLGVGRLQPWHSKVSRRIAGIKLPVTRAHNLKATTSTSGARVSGTTYHHPIDYVDKLREMLATVQSHGTFAVGGPIAGGAVNPGIEVSKIPSGCSTGLGPIALPLLESQALQLASVASQAPYGRGEQTLVDLTVRNTLQLGTSDFRVCNPKWQATLDDVVERVRQGLGVPGPVVAKPYKLLLYEKGSFFTSHMDTEKEDGMFATLSILLPSAYTGGELEVSHREETKTFDFAADNAYEAFFLAFYCDCQHEVKPITSGNRLCLIYNLCTQAGGSSAPVPVADENDHRVARIATCMQKWKEDDSTRPLKLLHILEHKYSADGLEGGLAALKGRDLVVAELLLAAQQQSAHQQRSSSHTSFSGGQRSSMPPPQRPSFELNLALVCLTEWGQDEWFHNDWDDDDDDDDDDDEDEEVQDEDREDQDQETGASEWHKNKHVDVQLSAWTTLEGRRMDDDEMHKALGRTGRLDMKTESIQGDVFADARNQLPDESYVTQVAGNEGVPLTRTYKRAALVMWHAGRSSSRAK